MINKTRSTNESNFAEILIGVIVPKRQFYPFPARLWQTLNRMKRNYEQRNWSAIQDQQKHIYSCQQSWIVFIAQVAHKPRWVTHAL